MLKLTQKLLFVAIAASAASFGLQSTALAGEGGVAGAASFLLNATVVTDASIAVSIGKSGAYAAAQTATGASTQAVAAGSGGTITNAAGVIYVDSIAEESVANLAVGQVNEITGTTVSIDPDSGTPVTVTIP